MLEMFLLIPLQARGKSTVKLGANGKGRNLPPAISAFTTAM